MRGRQSPRYWLRLLDGFRRLLALYARRGPLGPGLDKRQVAALWTLLLCACACAAGPVPAARDALSAASVAVVLVDGTGDTYCGGVAIGPREILTANHCLRGGVSVRYLGYNEAPQELGGLGVYVRPPSHLATATTQNAARDLAWLRTEGPPFVSWAGYRRPSEFEEVYAIGPIAGWERREGELGGSFAGLFTGASIVGQSPLLTPVGGYTWFMGSTLTIAPGWSGSPVFASDGFLVGVVLACNRKYVFDDKGVAHAACREDYAIIGPVVVPSP